MQEVLQAVNAGATSLNSNTLANVNAMNVELHNADGSLAGKYTLSNFLENVIYQFLATTKASALASVLGASVTALGTSDNLFDLPKVGWYIWTGSGSAPQNNAAPQASGVLYQVLGNVNCLIQFTNFGTIYYTYRWKFQGGTWQSWKQVSLVTPTT